ncbi:septum site-determining protein Ssd [Arthrobacter sp. ISL-85]|uniref:septum site-determining protein Ssd n=1 Tax=Arthrobacter sp. ISL-85 TaxID=2819115 RepID=UPI0020352FB5|nr:septum site-determining protein Ssd [Arthrobacter sp. ISL-85]
MSRHQLNAPHSGPGQAAVSSRRPPDPAPPSLVSLPAPAEAASWLPDGSLPGRSAPGGSGPEGLGPDGSGEVLLVTSSGVLRAEVERIVAAAGARLRVVPDAVEAGRYWDAASAVLVGSDVRELPPRRRTPAVMVGLDGEGDSLWHLAAALGAERVAVLPDAAAWLADHLSRSRSPGPGGLVLGITGGCGGAGATTAAIWIAQAAAGLGVRVLLVDGDPWGGGLELALAAEDNPGLRWPDLAEARGSIDPLQLSDSLPVAGGFSFLSWPATREQPAPVAAAATAGVLDAARRGYELVVVDVGRGAEPLHTVAWDCDRIMVVVPAQLKAAVAAVRLLQELPPVEAALLVRARPGSALDGSLIADAVGLPVQGRIPELRAVPGAMESGRLLDFGKRRTIRHFGGTVLDWLGEDLKAGDIA